MFKNSLFKDRIKKKVICLALALFTTGAAAGCGSVPNSSNTSGTSGNNTLTISVITKDMYLDAAVKKFEQDHPGTTIDIKEYTSNPLPASDGKNVMVRVGGEKPEDVEKYVSDINTQLMSGKGPDIMLLSPLPYQNYIDKGMLANLSDMIKDDKSFDMSKYYGNILDAMKYNGSLYGLPLSVSLNVLEANKALLDKYGINIDDRQWSWSDFEQAAEKVVEGSKNDGVSGMYALAGVDGSMLISSLVSESYDKFVDKGKKTANFDSKEFTDILNLAKSMIDKNYINTDTSQGKMVDLASRGNTVFTANGLMGYMDLTMAKMTYSDGFEFLKFPGEGSGLSFTSSALYGINNKSSNKELAWEFMKYLLSDEMESQPTLGGLPINKAASQKAAQDTINRSQNKGGKIVMNGQTVTGQPVTQEDIDSVQNLLNSADTYIASDQKVLTIVQEETKAFFEGQKSAEDTAKAIQDRVNIYINE